MAGLKFSQSLNLNSYTTQIKEMKCFDLTFTTKKKKKHFAKKKKYHIVKIHR